MSQAITISATPGNFMQTLHYSQGDVGRDFTINIDPDFTVPSGATVEIVATKPSGFGFTVAGTVTDNSIAFTTTEAMTDEWGTFAAELKITYNSDVIGTANFWMKGEQNPHPDSTVDGQQGTIVPQLTLLVERVETAASNILDMNVTATTLAAGSDATYSYDSDTNTATFGIPRGADGSLASGVLASTYSSSATYAVGDYVYYSGDLYRCTTAITTAEAWTAGHWTEVALADEVSDVKNDFSDLKDDLYTVLPTENLYTSGTATLQARAMTSSSTVIETNYTYGHYLIIPIDSDEGLITVKRTNSCSLRVCTTVDYPANGVSVSGYQNTGDGYTVSITPSASAKYLLVLYWISNVDSITEEQALAGMEVFYGSTWVDGTLKSDTDIAALAETVEENKIDVYEQLASWNMYNSSVTKRTMGFPSESATTLPSGTHSYYLIFQIDSTKGTITVQRTNNANLLAVTTATDPAVGTSIIQRVASTSGTDLEITPDNTANYLALLYWIDNLDTATEAEALDGIKVFYGETWYPKLDTRIENLENTQYVTTPNALFGFDDFTVPVIDSSEYSDIDFTSNYQNFMPTMYSKFDALVASYPSYVSKVDTVSYVDTDLEYPAYASGYNTYMYILSSSNGLSGSSAPKHKMLWICGTHGDERDSTFTAYLIAKRLCEALASDKDVMKLRETFDIYIVPVLNGYGSLYEGTDENNPNLGRTNYNGVNINRNYPASGWTQSGSAGEENYTGATAGSEFETQLGMALIEKINPHVMIDMHSHVVTQYAQYSEFPATHYGANKVFYQSILDISIAFKSAYSEYYGTSGTLPAGPTPASEAVAVGETCNWSTQYGTPFACTIECPCTIGFNNGVYGGEWHHTRDGVIYGLNEYLYLCQILHIAQWVMAFYN